MIDLGKLENQLILHEGLRLSPYTDTVGKLTIGVGYNLADRGLGPLVAAAGRPLSLADLEAGKFTEADARAVLRADVQEFQRQVRAAFPAFDQLGEPRQRAVIDFVFNLGLTRARAFRSAIDALKRAIAATDPRVAQAFFTEAAWHVMDSLWARQVDDGLAGKFGRADRVANMIRTGRDYER